MSISKDQFQKLRKLTTGKVRASYVSVFQPRLNENNGNMEYSMELIIDKQDTATINKLKKAMQAAEKFKFPKGRPASKEWFDCLIDADKEVVYIEGQGGKPDTEIPLTEKRPETKGAYLLRVKNQKQVPIVDRQKEPVIDESEFQSGDYCRASINVHPFVAGKNAGITVYLNAVQVIAKGEPLGSGSVNPDEEFDEWDEEETTEEWD